MPRMVNRAATKPHLRRQVQPCIFSFVEWLPIVVVHLEGLPARRPTRARLSQTLLAPTSKLGRERSLA